MLRIRALALLLFSLATGARADTWACAEALPADSEAAAQAMDAGWNPGDTCAAEIFLDPDWSDTADSARRSDAAYSLRQSQGAYSTRWRDRTESGNWASRFDGRGDTLEQAQVGWRGAKWTFAAGDREDAELRLRPAWLPRRIEPNHWISAGNSFPLAGSASAPQRFAAGYTAGAMRIYALEAWQTLHPRRVPSWDPPWELRHQTLGAEISTSWPAALDWAQTQIGRNGSDSVSEQLASLSLASPSRVAEFDWAWNGTREHPGGAQALGFHLRYPFGMGEGELLWRRFGARWSSVWDSTWMDDAVSEDSDTAAADWGAGGLALRLRLPLPGRPHASFVEGESWQSWGAQGAPHGSGMRGQFRWRRRGWFFSCRGLVREYVYATGTVSRYRSLWWSVDFGTRWRCRLRAFQIWETRAWKQGEAVAFSCPWGRLQFRPGLRLQSAAGSGFAGQWSTGLGWRLSRAWQFESEIRRPLPTLAAAEPPAWKMTLRYALRVRNRPGDGSR